MTLSAHYVSARVRVKVVIIEAGKIYCDIRATINDASTS